LYLTLKPYGVQDFAWALGIFSTAGLTMFPLWRMFKLIWKTKDQPVNRARLGITVSFVVGIAIAFALVPIPWHVDSPFLLQPREVRQVYVSTPGFVAEVKVQPEQSVKAGDVLAVLVNPELESRIREADMEIRKETARLAAMRAINDRAEIEASKQRLISLTTEREELLRQTQELIIKAPCDGRIIPPGRASEKPKSTTSDALAKWYGTPLESRNKDTWLAHANLALKHRSR
jgi:putative peptide zinc metalloprotease protein